MRGSRCRRTRAGQAFHPYSDTAGGQGSGHTCTHTHMAGPAVQRHESARRPSASICHPPCTPTLPPPPAAARSPVFAPHRACGLARGCPRAGMRIRLHATTATAPSFRRARSAPGEQPALAWRASVALGLRPRKAGWSALTGPQIAVAGRGTCVEMRRVWTSRICCTTIYTTLSDRVCVHRISLLQPRAHLAGRTPCRTRPLATCVASCSTQKTLLPPRPPSV